MPVPVTSTNPQGKGLACHQNKSLPSAGSLFSRLGAESAEKALEDKKNDVLPRQTGAAQAARSVDTSARPTCEHAVECNNLVFRYTGPDGLPMAGTPILDGVNLKLPPGSRMLLVGGNGAGKTTLLQILAGKHMVPQEAVRVLEKPPFHATSLTTTGALSYIGGNWERDIAFAGYSVPLAGDFPAAQMLDSIPNTDPARRRRIVDVLDIDETWRMHTVSDGQRRRVQIACGLLRPAQVLLLDEITVDLDVLVREDLMEFLREESESRGCTIIYITHIFDGMEAWPTHVGFLADGAFAAVREAADIPELRSGHLMELVEAFLLQHWLRRAESAAAGERAAHPESRKRFEYLRNNGYTAGRFASSLA